MTGGARDRRRLTKNDEALSAEQVLAFAAELIDPPAPAPQRVLLQQQTSTTG